jgi:tRNA A-37 threonylcarbamoyl transferase component Bud32
MSQKPAKNHFQLIKEGRTRILADPQFLKSLREMGCEKVEKLFEKIRIDPDRAGRYGLGLFSPDGKPDHRFVIRRYGRGGLLRRLLGDRFVFGSRPFREILITDQIRKRGIPTTRVVAALHHRIWGPVYRGELISKEIPDANDLVSVFQNLGDPPSEEEITLKRQVTREAGRTVRLMHDQGIYHGDLNVRNVLAQISKPRCAKVYIIDFDRSKILETLSTRKRMKNILRLNRSAEKLKAEGLRISYTDKTRFLDAYAEGDRQLILSVRRYLKNYRLYTRWYRLGWFADRLFNPSPR